ncbi:MAG: hypothetical protein JNL47_08120 [Bacteroidia bacterium]|nr:hypothetical protein [Bacteroidia bacterium]
MPVFPNTGIGINHETVLHNWGTQNIFVGVGAGKQNITGNGNTFIGSHSGSDMEVNNAIAIGSHTKVNCSDCTVIGGRFTGINTDRPQATLEVNGSLATKELFLITNEGKTDLMALVMQLKADIEVLKQQITASIKN